MRYFKRFTPILLGMGLLALTALTPGIALADKASRDVAQDKHDTKKDARDLRHDVAGLRQDQVQKALIEIDLRKDLQHPLANSRDIRHDLQRLSVLQHDINRDKRDIRRDARDLRRDVADLVADQAPPAQP